MSIPGGGFGAGDFGDMGGFDFAKMGEALSRLGRAISANATGATGATGVTGGGISPDAVREMATLTNDKAPSANEISAGLEALAVAQLWLDPKTDFTAPVAPAQIWSRSQWIDETLVGWCEILAPLAQSLSGAVSGAISGLTKEALGDAFGDSLSDESGNQNSNPFSSFGFGPPSNSENAKNDDPKINPNAGNSNTENSNTENPMAGIFNQMSNAMRAFGGVIFATQLGETIKTTAGSVTGGADIGIPLLTNNRPALIATNCNAWGAELGIPEAELRYYLALREVAGVRLFNNVPWLREYITNAIKSYSAGIKVNIEKIQEGMAGMAGIGTSPEALNEAIANGLFTTDETPSQKSAILRLETIAALVEGWVDEVSASAALEHLPALPALRESARRGRATGGPMQKAFAALIGLEISPRAFRDAATFFNYIATNESISQRDELWSSPESLPTIEEITNPSAFRKGRSAPDDLSTL